MAALPFRIAALPEHQTTSSQKESFIGLQQRAQRALARQLTYQAKKADRIRGCEPDSISAMMRSSAKVRGMLESIHPINPDAHVLEVGSGAHGLIFYFGAR